MSNDKAQADLQPPILDLYSLEDAANYLLSNINGYKYYSAGTVESLIEAGYLIVCVRDETRSGRWVYLDVYAYHEFKVKGWPSMVSASIMDARLGNYIFLASNEKRFFGSEIRVPRSELDRYLDGPSKARASRAFRIREGILDLENGTKKVAVPKVIEYILKELKHYKPEIEIESLRGNVDDFYEFCKQLSPVIKTIPGKDTFKQYCKRKGTSRPPLCGWRTNAFSDSKFWESIISQWEKEI